MNEPNASEMSRFPTILTIKKHANKCVCVLAHVQQKKLKDCSAIIILRQIMQAPVKVQFNIPSLRLSPTLAFILMIFSLADTKLTQN